MMQQARKSQLWVETLVAPNPPRMFGSTGGFARTLLGAVIVGCSITCDTPPERVGVWNVNLTVAGQSVWHNSSAGENIPQAMFEGVCGEG